METLRIIPPSAKPGGPTLARGTKILNPDGSPVPGVTRIELEAEAGEIWLARIHCRVRIDGELVANVMPPETVPPALARIEAKLDALLEALAEEDQRDEAPALTLDGELAGSPRPEGEPL